MLPLRLLAQSLHGDTSLQYPGKAWHMHAYTAARADTYETALDRSLKLLHA